MRSYERARKSILARITKYTEITFGGATSGVCKKLEESVYGASSGLLPCIKTFVNSIAQRYYHVLCAGRIFSSPNFDLSRWSPPTGNAQKFLPPPLAAPPKPFPANG